MKLHCRFFCLGKLKVAYKQKAAGIRNLCVWGGRGLSSSGTLAYKLLTFKPLKNTFTDHPGILGPGFAPHHWHGVKYAVTVVKIKPKLVFIVKVDRFFTIIKVF
jgi:hypothetical protein